MYIHVQVTPDSKKERFVTVDETHFTVSVREPAAQNLANRRVQELLCEYFGREKGQIRLISGHRSPKKIFDINQ